MSKTADDKTLYGIMAEFHDPTAVVKAAQSAYDAGYRKMDAFTPFPIEELSEALGYHSRGRLPFLVLMGGLFGAAVGFGLQYWVSVMAYPLNIGGRPLNSWPAFIPVTFEMTILFAAVTAVFAMIGLNGLPRPHHPVFNAPNFALASQERFFFCIEAQDPQFDPVATRRFMESMGAAEVEDIDS